MDPSDRQQRLQMRQRGAATRQINAVDFGLSFDPTPRRSAPNTPQRASRSRQARTPLTERGAALRRPTKTPSKASRRPENGTGSQSQATAAASSSARPPPGVYDIPEDGVETRATKRRKLSSEHETNQLITPTASQVPNSNLSQNGPAPPGRLSSARQQIQTEISGRSQPDPAVQSGKPAARINPTADKENAAPGSETVKLPQSVTASTSDATGQRARSLRSASRDSDNLSIHSAVGDIGSEDEVLVAVFEDSEDESGADNQEDLSLMTAQGEWPDGSMEIVAVLDDTTIYGNDTTDDHAIAPSLPTQDQPETPAPRFANIKRKRDSFKTPALPATKRRGSLTPRPSSRVPTPHQTESQATPHAHPASDQGWNQGDRDEEDETYLQPTSPVIPTPKTVAKKSRKKTAATKAGSRRRGNRKTTSRSESKSTTFPVVCRRLKNISALPTIPEEGAEDEDNTTITTAESNSKPDHPLDRRNPNSVDILSQFCLEHLGSTTTTTTTNPIHTKTGSTTHQALNSLSSSLSSHLSDLSVHLDHRLDLEAQVRRSDRAKVEKRREWIRVRAEREEVRRRLDEARAERDRRQDHLRSDWTLSRAVSRVEMEVERARVGKAGGVVVDGVDLDLEVRLREAVVAPASRVGALDLLARLAGFNDVLEATLGVLEPASSSSSSCLSLAV